MDNKYLTPKQLCTRWENAVCIGTLANWRNKNKGPSYIKIGKKILYLKKAVEAYEQEKEKKVFI